MEEVGRKRRGGAVIYCGSMARQPGLALVVQNILPLHRRSFRSGRNDDNSNGVRRREIQISTRAWARERERATPPEENWTSGRGIGASRPSGNCVPIRCSSSCAWGRTSFPRRSILTGCNTTTKTQTHASVGRASCRGKPIC